MFIVYFLFSIQLLLLLQIFLLKLMLFPMLSGSNFKIWKENIEFALGCVELELALRMKRHISTPENLNEAKIEKWERSNCLSVMIYETLHSRSL